METTRFFEEFIGIVREQVPVMRNGKPTKRTKEVIVHKYGEVEFVLTEIEGHKCYMEKNPSHGSARVRNLDGDAVTVNYQIGYSGKVEHTRRLLVDPNTKKPIYYNLGYNGGTLRGSRSYDLGINW